MRGLARSIDLLSPGGARAVEPEFMLSPGGARFVVPGTAHASQRRSIHPCHPLAGTPAKSSETGDPQPNLKPGTTTRAPPQSERFSIPIGNTSNPRTGDCTDKHLSLRLAPRAKISPPGGEHPAPDFDFSKPIDLETDFDPWDLEGPATFQTGHTWRGALRRARDRPPHPNAGPIAHATPLREPPRNPAKPVILSQISNRARRRVPLKMAPN